MFSQFSQRANGTEIMDDLTLQGTELEKTLCNLHWVNQWLGGHASVRHSLKTGLTLQPSVQQNRPIRLIDVGCGGGDSLRMLAKYGRKKSIPFQLTGLDANPHIIDWAKGQSGSFPEINYLQANVFQDVVDWGEFDVVMCGLFLHHFSEAEQLQLLQSWKEAGVQLILINDLQRHWLPYYLFRITSTLLRFTPMAKADGAMSVRRGFRKQELVQLMDEYRPSSYRCRWRWAFQYQLIVIP